MDKSKLYAFIFYLICIILWGWAMQDKTVEQTYEKLKDKKLTWFWLWFFNIKRNRKNCIKFIKLSCWFGIILMTIFILGIMFLGE
jgi:membrane protein insertase Oxa1/YidC/SpoIIIJ